MSNLHFAASFLAAGLAAGSLLAQTTVTVPCNLDNTLYEHPTGALSNGVGPGVFVGVTATGGLRRALLRFNVAGTIPAGARIVSAQLNFNVAQSTVALPTPMTVHRVSQAWGEGTSFAGGGGGAGAPATNGDATWIHAVRPGSLWTTPGGDFAPASFTMPLPAAGPAASPVGVANADVQFWLDNPTQNHGWLLKTDEQLSSTARRVDSRESLGTKPSLTVSYLVNGQAGTYGVGCPVGAGTYGTSFVGAPIGGTSLAILHNNAVPLSIGVNYYSLGVDPVGLPLLPGCTVYLPLSLPLIPGDAFLTDAVGAGGSSFAVPAGFPGFLVACQGAVLANNPLGFVVSNAALALLQ
jgi:hypothetical protein